MSDPCSISMNNGLRDKRYSDSFLRNTYMPLHDGLEDVDLDGDNQFNKHTPQKYGIRNTKFLYYKNFKNIHWFLEKFMLILAILVMGGLKCVKSYCIYIAIRRLYEDSEHLLVFLFMMDIVIDLFFKVTSSNGWLWYKNRYVIKPVKKKDY